MFLSYSLVVWSFGLFGAGEMRVALRYANFTGGIYLVYLVVWSIW
jgi:hypothetical protein